MHHFFLLIGFFLAFFFVISLVRVIINKYAFGLICFQKYPVRDTLAWMFKKPEILRRLLITLGVILFSHILFFIPLPGIDIVTLDSFLRSVNEMSSYSFSLIMRPEAFMRLSVASLGVEPFISACLLLQIISIFIPRLRRLSFAGQSGRSTIGKYTYTLAIILSLIQGVFLSLWVQSPGNFHGIAMVFTPGALFILSTALTVTVGFILFILAAEFINKYGIGNGIPIIIIASIVFRIPSILYPVISMVKIGQIVNYLPIFWIIISLAVTYLIFYVTRLTRKVEIKGKNNKKYFISFRPTIVGLVPMGWALFLSAIPMNIALLPGYSPPAEIFISGSILNYILNFFLIALFIYFYIFVVFSPQYLKRLLKRHDYSTVDTDNTISEIKIIMAKVLVITTLFCISIYLLPRLVSYFFTIPSYPLLSLLCGISLVMLIGVFSDTLSQLEFFRDKDSSGIKDWVILYTAFDEIEAEIKKNYLCDKEIKALIKPYRYSWGLPIRTVVDKYQLYVPADSKEQALKLILAVEARS